MCGHPCVSVGLCALSTNHSNSFLAYPGSDTIGEIIVYDSNNLVKILAKNILLLILVSVSCYTWDKCLMFSADAPHESFSCCVLNLFFYSEHCDHDSSSWQSTGCHHLQCFRHQTGQCFWKGKEPRFIIQTHSQVNPTKLVKNMSGSCFTLNPKGRNRGFNALKCDVYLLTHRASKM